MEHKSIPMLLVVTHGSFGKEIIKSAEMIIGKQENLKAVSLLPGMDMEEFLAKVRSELEAAPEGSLVLCDLFGGTPSNVTASLLAAHAVCAVTGLNLAMLIEACTMRASMKGKTLAEAVLAAAAAGCRDLRKEIETMEADI